MSDAEMNEVENGTESGVEEEETTVVEDLKESAGSPASNHGSNDTPAKSPSRSRSHSPRKKSYSRSRSKSQSRSRSRSRRKHHKRSRSRSRSPYYSSRRSRSRSRSRGRHHRRRNSHRSKSRSPMSGRKRHQGDRENPGTSRCLGIFGLSLYTRETDLREVFGKYGPVEEVQIVYDTQSGRSRGFAFLYFDRLEDAVAAKDGCVGQEIDGRKIRVDFSITKRAHTPTPGIYMGKPTYSNRYRNRDRSPSPYRRGGYGRRRGRSRSRSYSPNRRYRY